MSNKLKQMNTTEAMNFRAMRKMEKCSHDFIIIKEIDYDNDRIYERLVCRKCNYSD